MLSKQIGKPPGGWLFTVGITPMWGDSGLFAAEVASQAGFEPATRCLEGSRSVHLSYWDAMRASEALCC